MRIRAEVFSRMIDHARQEAPRECCGLLAGSAAEIDHLIRCTNGLRSDTAFSIPPEELFAARRELRDRGCSLQGIYHSHPRSEAVPSPRDLAEFHYPEVGCWIVSLQGGEPVVRCFRLRDGAAREEAYTISDRAAARGMIG